MARSDQMKALLRAYAGNNAEQFLSVAMQVAAEEARKGHVKLAAEIRDLIDEAKTRAKAQQLSRPIPLAQPRGELSELLSVTYPQAHLREMVLSSAVLRKLQRVLKEQRESERLKTHSLSPRRKLLLVGPPGTGKTMTAGVLAGELRLPLFTARLDNLITKFMGESSSKLRLVFDAIRITRGVYFFDEFDSLGLQRGAQFDVAEMRRTLNTFLQAIDQDSSDSLIVAATNLGKDLDVALFRRFDDVIRYETPDDAQIEQLLKNKLSVFTAKSFDYRSLVSTARGRSHADIVRACLDAAKDSVIERHDFVTEDGVRQHLQERTVGAGP